MVRTKADNSARKAVAAKAPRKALAPTGGSSMMSPKSGGKKDKYGGGNAVFARPTPEWQKSITTFFPATPGSSGKENTNPEDGPSSSKDLERVETEAAGSSSSGESSRHQEQEEEMDDDRKPTEDEVQDEVEDAEEEEEEDKPAEEEEEDKPAASSSSSKSFQRNRCVSDSDDD